MTQKSTGIYMRRLALSLLGVVLFAGNAEAADLMQKLEAQREIVKFPPQMQQHFLSGMRDHLLAVSQIQRALAEGRFDKAGEIAGSRLGMNAPSSMACKPGMEHMNEMARLMPDGMRKAGRRMHHAADQFAHDVQQHDLRAAVASLASVTAACVACHASYRLDR